MEKMTEEKEGIREAWWLEAEKKRSPRLNYLRKAIWSKGAKGGDWQPGIKMCLEKVKWFTKVFKETDGQPWVIRRAKALAALLENIPIFITDQSQLVGYAGSKPNTILLQPDMSYIIYDDIYYDWKGYIEEEDRGWARECLDYWQDKCFQAQAERYLSEEEMQMTKMGMQLAGQQYIDGFTSAQIDYEFIFNNGYNKILDMISEQRKKYFIQLTSGTATPATAGFQEKIDQLDAMAIAVNGFIKWVQRYSRLAKIVAENFETDTKRRQELIKMSEMLARVPANPPEHFHEACQTEHLVTICARAIERGHTGWGWRPDVALWPYYRKDVLEDKILTRDEAREIMVELMFRTYETCKAWSRIYREIIMGGVGPWVWTLGGVNGDGSDACNDVTTLVLEAAQLARVAEPSIGFRYHKKQDMQALRAAFETVRQGLGYPSFKNDNISMHHLMKHFGATLEEARSWSHVVCMSPCVTGKKGQGVRYASGMLQATKNFEVALYDGFDPAVTRMQLGPHTGDATKFETYEQFKEAFRQQLRYACETSTRTRGNNRWVESRYAQQPFLSAGFERCIELGEDCTMPNELCNAWVTFTAANDVGDCLYAIKKLVFDEKKYTMSQLIEALKANWEGYELMRRDFVNVPKWGNDDDEADKETVWVHRVYEEEMERNIEWSGGRFMALPQNGASFVVGASRIGALPNGRHLGDPMYDGGCSPGAGMDKKGPTSVLKSVSKIDHRSMKGNLLNQRLNPIQFAGEKGFNLFASYMNTWCDLGIDQVQFNFVDSETLKAAQIEPEKYSELTVRVAGYSAMYVELNRMTQEAIIARTVQKI